MMHPVHLQVETLLRHNKTEDAIRRLQTHLTEYPDDDHAKYLLAFAYYLSNRLPEARQAAEILHSSDPEQPHVVRLLTEIDIAEDQYSAAEAKANFLVSLDPDDADAYVLLGRVRYLQNYYDSALQHIDKALGLDAGHKEALNLKIRISDTVGNYDQARASIKELLHLDPENPTTLANHGIQLLNEGQVEEALRIFSQALSLQPTNMLARQGMMEALKSRFWIYRLFYHYERFMARLSGGNAWMVIIGTYVAARVIGGIADVSEGNLKWILNGAVILIALTFFLSWVVNPLMNLLLSQNKYGKLLLDLREKKMARLTGICLLLSLLSLVAFLVTGYYQALLGTLLFAGLMIPAGTHLNPPKEERQKKLRIFGLVILAVGLVGILISESSIFLIAFLGLFVYQFYYNKLMISEFSRKFEQ